MIDWPIIPPYRTGEVPPISSQEMLVVDPSISLAKVAAGGTIPGQHYRFPLPSRVEFLRSLIPEYTPDENSPLYQGRQTAPQFAWARVLVTLRRPDSTIIINQIPALALGIGPPTALKPLHYFAQGTLIDPWQSYIETPIPVVGAYVFPFKATYW